MLHARVDGLPRSIRTVAVAIPFALAMVEYWPRPLMTWQYPIPAPMRAWSSDPGKWAVLDAWDFYRPRWHATIHRKPIIGGYLSRAPARLQDSLHRNPVVRAIMFPNERWATSRVDPTIDFVWRGRRPDESVSANDFFATWDGALSCPSTGHYRFWFSANDDATIGLDGQELMAMRGRCGASQPCEIAAERDLSAGPHTLRVVYHERAGNGEAHLAWAPPGGEREVVPQSALTSPHGEAGLQATYIDGEPDMSGLGQAGGRAALRALSVRYVVLQETPNRCVQEELALPLAYAGEDVRIYEVPSR